MTRTTRDSRKAAGYSEIRAALLAARADAANYGVPKPDGIEKRACFTLPFFENTITNWREVYDDEYHRAVARRLADATAAERAVLNRISDENFSIRRAEDRTLAREVLDLRKELKQVEADLEATSARLSAHLEEKPEGALAGSAAAVAGA